MSENRSTQLSAVRYSVEFYGPIPEHLEIGDKLRIEGEVTVRGLSGDMVDVTAIGRDPEFLVGGVSVDLLSNHLEVNRG